MLGNNTENYSVCICFFTNLCVFRLLETNLLSLPIFLTFTNGRHRWPQLTSYCFWKRQVFVFYRQFESENLTIALYLKYCITFSASMADNGKSLGKTYTTTRKQNHPHSAISCKLFTALRKRSNSWLKGVDSERIQSSNNFQSFYYYYYYLQLQLLLVYALHCKLKKCMQYCTHLQEHKDGPRWGPSPSWSNFFFLIYLFIIFFIFVVSSPSKTLGLPSFPTNLANLTQLTTI